VETQQTPEFADWLNSLADAAGQTKIRVRIARIEAGLMGDVKSVGDGEARFGSTSGRDIGSISPVAVACC
jgi:putative addiction module killer protein